MYSHRIIRNGKWRRSTAFLHWCASEPFRLLITEVIAGGIRNLNLIDLLCVDFTKWNWHLCLSHKLFQSLSPWALPPVTKRPNYCENLLNNFELSYSRHWRLIQSWFITWPFGDSQNIMHIFTFEHYDALPIAVVECWKGPELSNLYRSSYPPLIACNHPWSVARFALVSFSVTPFQFLIDSSALSTTVTILNASDCLLI